MTTTPQPMSNQICYQVSKPEMEFHMIDIIYAALTMCEQTEKTTFSCKATQGKSSMYIGVGQGTCKRLRTYLALAYTTLVVLVTLRLIKYNLLHHIKHISSLVFVENNLFGLFVEYISEIPQKFPRGSSVFAYLLVLRVLLHVWKIEVIKFLLEDLVMICNDDIFKNILQNSDSTYFFGDINYSYSITLTQPLLDYDIDKESLKLTLINATYRVFHND